MPGEAQLRDYLQTVILDVYRRNGFRRIMTPAIEDAENLDKSEGGENLNLIFKILKRGEKLEKAIAAGNMDDLSDMGLRYDLTLPLSRYYANNKEKLLLPFQCIQIDKVYRAERPQKGRLREFVQCDIDILGSSSWCCEVELIDVTAQALLAIGIGEFRIKINDRRILRNVLENLGFLERDLDSVCISFDKLDKILYNLLSNAVKYTPEGKTIRITAYIVHKEDGRFLVLKVADEGVGIASGELARIFTRFYSDRKNKGVESNGIGLSLTKDLVCLHHGNIDVESTLGSGSCFTVEIPVDKEAYAADERVEEVSVLPADEIASEPNTEAEPVLPEENTDRPTLLLIDDNTELLYIMLCEPVGCGLCRCCLKVIEITVLLLIIGKTCSHVVENLNCEILSSLISKVDTKP